MGCSQNFTTQLLTKRLSCLRRFGFVTLVALTVAGLLPASANAQLRSGRSSRQMVRGDYDSRSHVTPQPLQSVPRETGYASHVVRSSQNPNRIASSNPRGSSDHSAVHPAGCASCTAKGNVVSGASIEPLPIADSYVGEELVHRDQPAHDDYYVDEPYIARGSQRDCNCRECQSQFPMEYIGNSYGPKCDGCDSCDSGRGECANSVQLGGLFCNLRNRLYFRIQAASFSPDGTLLPALVTTGPISAGSADVGQIGRPDTTVLFGDSIAGDGDRIGVRFELGTWFDAQRTRGIMYRMFSTGDLEDSFAGNEFTNEVLARPFFDARTNTESTNLITFPGLATGSINAAFNTNSYGNEVLYRRAVTCWSRSRWDLLIGYQQMRLEDDLQISSSTTDGLATLEVRDRFRTKNEFNGLALGTNYRLRGRCWTFEGLIKLGFGSVDREVTIDGFRRTTVSANNQFEEDQGLLARRTNSGTFSDDTFVVVPELGLNLSYRLTPKWEWSAGYSFIALADVARAGQQIDLRSNLSDPIVGTLAPEFNLVEEGFSLSSFNFGGQYNY